jgi:hypothetical protein
MFWADFIVGKKLQLPTYRDSLTERGTVQMLTVSREVALEVQVSCIVLKSFVFISWLQKCHLTVVFFCLLLPQNFDKLKSFP